VATIPLVAGHVLTVEGGQWVPRPLPVPPPAPTAPPIPALAGDVTGTLGNNSISSLQKIPLVASNPDPGNVLFFDGTNWIPMAATKALDLQFVGRGTKLPYEIVAAAEVSMRTGGNATVNASFDHQYGKWKIDKAVLAGASMARLEFLLIADGADKFTGYDVKLTPIFRKAGFRLYLGERVKAEASDTARIVVLVAADADIDPNGAQFAFQMEVSRYGEG
jgi:hypothetical protein